MDATVKSDGPPGEKSGELGDQASCELGSWEAGFLVADRLHP